jgi:hypothetical protein
MGEVIVLIPRELRDALLVAQRELLRLDRALAELRAAGAAETARDATVALRARRDQLEQDLETVLETWRGGWIDARAAALQITRCLSPLPKLGW